MNNKWTIGEMAKLFDVSTDTLRKLGEGNIVEANIAFNTALLLMGGISLLFTAIAVAFPAQIAHFLGANEHLMPQVTMYISYLSLSLPFLASMMVLDYVLKTMAMPVYAMLALVVPLAAICCLIGC